jgi:hypothetical protein
MWDRASVFSPSGLAWTERVDFPKPQLRGAFMNSSTVRFKLCLLVPVSLAASIGVSAQAPLEPAQMPARTSAYILWRGAPLPDARRGNSLLSLWDDPDLAPLRAGLFQSFQSNSAKDSGKPALTRAEAEEYSSLLENPFVLGYIRQPEAKRAAKLAPAKAADPWNGMFFVYNRTGKEALLTKAVLRLRSQEKEAPQLSQITIAGIPVLKVERKDNVTYWGEHGKYALSSSEPAVFEEILSRLDGKSAGASSLVQTPAHQGAQPLLGRGLLEFFVRVPQLRDLAPDADNAAFKFTPLLDALKLENIHSFAGQLTLEGAKARVQGAILGEAAPGSIFDLWSSGQQSPMSLALVPPDTISYSQAQFNLAAFYNLLKRAFHASLAPPQQGGADMVEAMAAARIGMSLPEALNLLNGEFASIQTNPALDPQNAVYFLGIRNKPQTLKLLRTVFSDRLGTERNEGDVTFLKVSLSGSQSNGGLAQWNFYQLAVTPDFVLGASRTETLREFLARRASVSGARLAMPAAFQAARAQFPNTLDGMGFINFQKVDWPAVKSRWIEEASKAADKKSAGASNSSASKVPDWLVNLNPDVFPRHLHFLAGASWKDAQGIHFDEWLE